MHGFCTDFARFQTVQRVLFDAKSDKGCRNCRVKNHVALIKNCDDSKLPEIETNRRLALLISGPRVRVPGGAPTFERQIVRFGVLSLCRKAAAHFLHTVCTFARIGGFSAQGLHSLLSFAFTTSTGHFDQSILGVPFSPHGFPAPSRRRFPALPLGGHGRVSHTDGHAVFKVQREKRQQKSRHRTDQLCLRFFWKVMLVGYVTAGKPRCSAPQGLNKYVKICYIQLLG